MSATEPIMKIANVFSGFIGLLFLAIGCRTDQGVETNSGVKTFIPVLQVKKFDSMAGKLAITIDDGPGAGTEAVVDWIQNWNLTHTDNPIKVTMFLTAKAVGTNSAKWTYYNDHIAKDPNFLLANHTYEHNMTRFGWQIKTAHEALHGLIPQNAVRFFRAPGGAPVTVARQAEAKASLPRDIDYVGGIFWDIGGAVSGSRDNPTGSADWSCWNPRTPPVMSLDTCLTGYQRETTRKNGGVVLFHDVTTKSGMLIPRYLEI